MQTQLLSSIVTASIDAIVCSDEQGRIILWNPAAEAMFGYTEAEALGRPLTMLLRGQDRAAHETGFQQFLQTGTTRLIGRITETFGQRKNGSVFLKEMSMAAEQVDGKWLFTAIMRDITQRKNLEAALQQRLAESERSRQSMLFMLEDLNESKGFMERSRREWMQTFDAVTSPIFLHDAQGNILRANRAYAMQAGMPVEAVVGKPYWLVFPRSDQRLHSCGEAEPAGEASEELITDKGTVFLVHSYTIEGSDASGRTFIHWMEDISVRKAYEQQLRQSLEGAIHATAAVVEARDPYTAGHQRRVADLACAIGQELGLEAEQVAGIHMGATIHDIGKINVPAEILSKPSRLSNIEYHLIKMHPQVGYDILKNISFPWPVADIAHQHHERLDGSGYPQGLRNGEICLEARIVGVADVVEAMASHRPYRAGLGMDHALAEIRRGRGSSYDADVADACIRLFDESRFSF